MKSLNAICLYCGKTGSISIEENAPPAALVLAEQNLSDWSRFHCVKIDDRTGEKIYPVLK